MRLVARVLLSLVSGVALALFMDWCAHVAYRSDAPLLAKILRWPNTLLEGLVPPTNIGSTEHPVFEATPVDVFLYLAGYPLGAIVYAAIAYVVFFRRRNAHAT
jgi:hypothetical protein